MASKQLNLPLAYPSPSPPVDAQVLFTHDVMHLSGFHEERAALCSEHAAFV